MWFFWGETSRLFSSQDVPHVLFYGPSGGGKRTRVLGCLRLLFGSGVEKLKVEHRGFAVGEGKREVELTTVSSLYHIELSPSDAGTNDRLVVQEVIKDMAASAPLQLRKDPDLPPFKVVVLHEVDQMTRLAQQALRRTMERYSRTCRIMMVAESATRVIEPLRSRCLGVRVPAPSDREIQMVLEHVASSEQVKLPPTFASQLVANSEGNLRRALLHFQASLAATGKLNDTQAISKGDWEIVCEEVAQMLISSQSPDQLAKVRARFYELLTHAIPADEIFRRVTGELLKRVDQDMSPKLCKIAAIFEHRMRISSKAIVHLEAFAAQFMHLYKTFVDDFMMMDE